MDRRIDEYKRNTMVPGHEGDVKVALSERNYRILDTAKEGDLLVVHYKKGIVYEEEVRSVGYVAKVNKNIIILHSSEVSPGQHFAGSPRALVRIRLEKIVGDIKNYSRNDRIILDEFPAASHRLSPGYTSK